MGLYVSLIVISKNFYITLFFGIHDPRNMHVYINFDVAYNYTWIDVVLFANIGLYVIH